MPEENGSKSSKSDTAKDSLTRDEIDQLSDMISDCMASTTLESEKEDTGSFTAAKEDDTGEFKPVQDTTKEP